MTVLELTALVGAGSVAAGLLGALTGLGGGVVIIPLLVVAFGVDIRYAIGASLVSIIATSSGAAAAYVEEGYTNVRVALLLEVATALGALSGAGVAAYLRTDVIAITFGLVLIYSAVQSIRPPITDVVAARPDSLAVSLRLDSTYPSTDGPRDYHVRNVPLGFGLMYGAGILSGLLGIGSGAIKVLAMDRAMRLPFKVSTTTSNFMIGVTAAASAGVYLRRGYVDPGLVMPVMLGVLTGSMIGARMLHRAPPARLRLIFALAIAGLGLEMLYRGMTGTL
jgi:uncharacterized protein